MAGRVLVPMPRVTCKSVKTPLMLRGTCRFWSDTNCHQDNVFFSAHFSETIPRHVLHVLAWLCSKRMRVLNWPACLYDVSQWKNMPRSDFLENAGGIKFTMSAYLHRKPTQTLKILFVFNYIQVEKNLQIIASCFNFRFTPVSQLLWNRGCKMSTKLEKMRGFSVCVWENRDGLWDR